MLPHNTSGLKIPALSVDVLTVMVGRFNEQVRDALNEAQLQCVCEHAGAAASPLLAQALLTLCSLHADGITEDGPIAIFAACVPTTPPPITTTRDIRAASTEVRAVVPSIRQ